MVVERAILAVADDESEVLRLQLACQGIDVAHSLHIVRDAKAAAQYLAGTGVYADRQLYPLPQLVLDIRSAKQSGNEVLEWIRSRKEFVCIPVVILSPSEYPAEIVRAAELGANSYLTKPGAPEAYQNLVTTVFKYWLEMNSLPDRGI